MKRIFHIIVTVVFFTACQDVLDKQPLDMISDAVVWNDPVLIDAYLAQQYKFTPVLVQDATTCISGWGLSPISVTGDVNFDYYRSIEFGGALILNSMSDEGLSGWVPATPDGWKKNGITIAGGFSEYWELPYKVIRNLNEFIERVPNSPMDPSLVALRTAEARFLRAFNYFAMVKRYGGIPLVTKVAQLSDPEEVLYPTRNSEKDIYDFVISEMNDIADVLDNTVEYGRPTKEAALALQCRAALYAASIAQFGTEQLNGLLGIPAADANSYYQKAYDSANEIIISGKHALYNQDADKVLNFKNVFLKKEGENPEVIFVVQHTLSDGLGGGNGWGYDFFQSPKPQAWNLGNANCPYLETVEAFEYVDGSSGQLDRQAIQQGLWDLDDIFGGKDPRFYATIWMQDTEWRGGKVDFHQGLLVNGELIDGKADAYENVPAWGNQETGYTRTGFGVMKYLDESLPMSPGVGWDASDYSVFRYGEILLNFAEAAFELGKTTEAMGAVNKIRNRSGIPELTTISRELIRQERRVELAYENHRYWDLRRWRIAKDVLTGHYSALQYILDYETRKYQLRVLEHIDGATGINFPAHNYYFPITLARTASNPKLVENPGYN